MAHAWLWVNPKIVLSTNNLEESYTIPTAIDVTGFKTHFIDGVTQLQIYDSYDFKQVDLKGLSTISVTNSTSAAINLNTVLPIGDYTIKLTIVSDTEERSYSHLKIGPVIKRLSPNNITEGYKNAVLNVTGLSTHFDDSTSITVYDSEKLQVANGSVIIVNSTTSAAISLSSGLPIGMYTVEIQTGLESVYTEFWVNPQIQLSPNSLVQGSTTNTAITVSGPNSHFDATTQLEIYNNNDSSQTDVKGYSTIAVVTSTLAIINLNADLPVGDYTIKLWTSTGPGTEERSYSHIQITAP